MRKSKRNALIAILESIAAEEMAIAQLIEAESKKINFAIEYIKEHYSDADLRKLVEVNESATRMIAQLTALEVVLTQKMKLALEHMPEESQPGPCPPCPAPTPRPPCPKPQPCSPKSPCPRRCCPLCCPPGCEPNCCPRCCPNRFRFW